MSKMSVKRNATVPGGPKAEPYGRMFLLAGAALVTSAAVIIFFNTFVFTEELIEVYDTITLASITLLPYLISAVIAAITAAGIITILPLLGNAGATGRILEKVVKLADGNLTDKSRIDSRNPELAQISQELNLAVGMLNSTIAQWKIINRQQWDLLQTIRQDAVKTDNAVTLSCIVKMEENWRRIAEIEEKFKV